MLEMEDKKKGTKVGGSWLKERVSMSEMDGWMDWSASMKCIYCTLVTLPNCVMVNFKLFY